MSLLLAMLSMNLEAKKSKPKPSAAKRAAQSTARMEEERNRAAEGADKEHLQREAEHKAKLAKLQQEHVEKQRQSTAEKNKKAKELLEKEITELEAKIADTRKHIAANDQKLKVLVPGLEQAQTKLRELGG